MTTLKQAFDIAIGAALFNTHTALPAIAIDFDDKNQTITAQIAITRMIDGKAVTIAPIVDVPIMPLTGGRYHITLPIEAGDECLVFFAERCIDNWFKKGGVQQPAEKRAHDISDGFAYFGINSEPNAILDYNTDGLAIRDETKKQHIILYRNGNIDITSPNAININSEQTVNINSNARHISMYANSNVTIHSGQDTRIIANGLASITAPLIELTGNVTITGNMVQVGTYTLNGITVDTHIHVDSMGGNTSPMQ